MNLENIPGVGPKTAKLLNKLNINDVKDLLTFYPHRYNVYTFSNEINESDTLTLNGTIESNPVVSYIKKNFNRLSFRLNIGNNIINVTIFNRAFMKNNLTIGKNITVIGKFNKNTFTASDIKFNIQNGDIESIYHLTNGLTNSSLSKIIACALNKYECPDYIPSIYKEKYNYPDKQASLFKIHLPKKYEDVNISRERLVYEELFEFSFKMNYINNENRKIKGIKRDIDNIKIQNFILSLPFSLTNDQQKSVDEILNDLSSEKQMNRLLLGDVGSGKTIVAAIAIYANFLSGLQAALMAPTEILAIQHFYSLKKILEPFNIVVDVITGSMTKKEKKSVYERVLSGDTNLLIGTHTLLSEELNFQNLGLVITDEQHRFGVKQRGILQNKSSYPDVLYLSATPIPRTYAMTIYGDLDISMIKTKPNGRKEIITKVKKEEEIKDVLRSMLDEIKKGHQIYVVSPLIEQNDELELNSVNDIKENLDKAFKGLIRTEIIHGKMKQSEKDAIMNDFKENKIKILISTTVIEVGIDVPNATMIVIYNAERFGLASLHQLRGRVGRNDLQSYCLLVSNYENERLKVMEDSNDGFYISQKDFEIRGHGDLFGVRQSGDMLFKIADLKRDYDILVKAKNDSDEYITSKRYLEDFHYKKLAENLNITD